jgi:ribonuclease BN (tRNA processing enzyme)
MNFDLTILGSASGQPVPDRSHASLALHNQDEIYLLDAGEGACASLLRWGLDPLRVKGIFITHTHPDHCLGIFMLLQYMHMKKHPGPVDIFLPESALPPFQAFMNQLYLVPGQINTTYHLRGLGDNNTFSGDWRLDTFPTRHLQRWADLDLPGVGSQAYAFRVSRPGQALFYSGDIAAFEDVGGDINKDDLLILEGAHIDVGSVIHWAVDAGLHRIVLTHVLPGTPWASEDLLQSARQRGLDVILAQDGMKLSF